MAANIQPYEIIVGPAKVWVAPVGSTFPSITDAPGTAWKALGMTDGGVKVKHSQTVVGIRTDQVTSPVKAVRSEEGLEISFNVVEMTLENYARCLHGTDPTDNGANVEMNLYRGGSHVQSVALLVRGEHLSPYGDWNLQYEVPSAYENGDPEVEFTKDNKAMLACKFDAITSDLSFTDDSEVFGVLRAGAA